MKFRQGRSNLFLPSSGRHNGNNLVVTFGTLKVWAEEGLVIYQVISPDAKDFGKCSQLTPNQAEGRFRRVFASMGKVTDLGMAKDAQDLRDMERAAVGIMEVIQRAREQEPAKKPTRVSFGGKPNLVWQNQKTLVEK